MNKNTLIRILQEAGDSWLTLLLVFLAIILLYVAFFSHNLVEKAITAAWVMFP